MMWKHNRKLFTKAKLGGDSEDGGRSEKSISVFDNDKNIIYFYKAVEPESVVNLCQKIDDLIPLLKMVQINYDLPAPPPIHLHIHTDGGDLMAGLAMHDKIANCSVPIYTYCEGLVASAGTLFSVAGARRFITRNSCMLIHQLQSELWGDYEKLKDEGQNVQLLMDFIRRIYKERTKMKDDLINEILKHDLYMSPEVCLDHGLVDEII